MTRHDHADSQATRARATRRKNQRARQAASLIARTDWLPGALVFWTGEREAIVRLENAPPPLRAVLQDRLANLPAGLYAVRLELPNANPTGRTRRRRESEATSGGDPLQLRVTAIDDVAPERVGATARAIEAVAKFPRAAARMVGEVDSWCERMRLRLAECRGAGEEVDAWCAGKPGAFALDARTIWLGTNAPLETARPDAALAAAWVEERSLDPAPVTADELAGLALLLAAVASARMEPARRALLLSHASILPGRQDLSFLPDPPFRSPNDAPAGGPGDPAGAAAIVAIAGGLQRMGAPDACAALAAWVEACRPRVPLLRFWRDVFAVVPSGGTAFDTRCARHLVASLDRHGARIAAELAPACAERADTVRALLPAVLARGPDATDRVLRRELWVTDEGSLDVALRFVEVAERAAGACGADAEIPMPRRVFCCADPILRDRLLEFGLAAWADHAADARVITFLLDKILTAAQRPGAAPWSTVLPRLHEEGFLLLRRAAAKPGAPKASLVGDAPVLAFFVLDVCARWIDAGFSETRRLARVLGDRWTSSEEASLEWDPDHDDHNQLLIRLAEARIARLLALLRLPRASRRHAWRGMDGWRIVEKHAIALAWMSACLDRTELAGRVVHALERIGLMARLDPGLRAARLFAPLDRPVDAPARWPPWVRRADAEALAEIRLASAIAEVPGGVPGAVRRVLDRKTTMTRERSALQARAEARRLSPAQSARADRLGRLLEDKEALEGELRRALRSTLPKQRALVGLAALETVVGQQLDRRWRELLGGSSVVPESPAWDNALLMLEGVSHNRRVLRRLLRHAAQGDRTWMRDLDPNREWLGRLAAAGVRTEEWLATRSRSVQIPGNAFTAYVATDPLEVLQMGSLFGTCLSADKFNAHAAVAAAVEVNKRVLYVKDRNGRVLGRQLLALTSAGEVIGFTCYGAGLDDHRKTGQWVKLALSLLTLDIARASGARLMAATRVAEGLTAAEERALSLFCKGYVDTLEPFDWWIEALAAEEPGFGEHDRDRLRSLLHESVSVARDARTSPDWRREELGWQACRALLWLGADAPPLPARQEQALGLDARHRLTTR